MANGPELSLLWSEEFADHHGGEVLEDIWNFDIGDGSSAGLVGWGNNELEYYTKDSVSINENLIISAQRLTPDSGLSCYYGPAQWKSGKIHTAGKIGFKYGRIEINAKMPSGVGTWPAFWMLGGDLLDGVPWPECGEIDIMEFRGDIPDQSTSAIHGPTTPQGSGLGARFVSGPPLSDGFHTYAIEWKKNSITFIVDGRVTGTYTSADTGSRGWVYNQKFFLILNLAMGGTYAGEYIDPALNQAQLHVDYIRFYSVNGVGKVIKG